MMKLGGAGTGCLVKELQRLGPKDLQAEASCDYIVFYLAVARSMSLGHPGNSDMRMWGYVQRDPQRCMCKIIHSEWEENSTSSIVTSSIVTNFLMVTLLGQTLRWLVVSSCTQGLTMRSGCQRHLCFLNHFKRIMRLYIFKLLG